MCRIKPAPCGRRLSSANMTNVMSPLSNRLDRQDLSGAAAGADVRRSEDVERAMFILAKPFDEDPGIDQFLELAGGQVGDEEEPRQVGEDILASQFGNLRAPVYKASDRSQVFVNPNRLRGIVVVFDDGVDQPGVEVR